MKKWIYVLVVLCITILIGCSGKVRSNTGTRPQHVSTPQVPETKKEKEIALSIITTNRFLYNMVSGIAQERHNADYMFTSLEGQQNFEFTDDSLNNIARQDLFFYTGANFEPWMDDFLDKLNKNKVGVVNISRGIKLLEYTTEHKYQEKVLKENPYYWLNLDNYKIMLLNIKNAIQEKDPKNRTLYEDNFASQLKVLAEYQKKAKELSDQLKDIVFIVNGDKLDYFTKYYNLRVIKVSDTSTLTPDEVKAELQKLDDKLKDEKKVIFLYTSSEDAVLDAGLSVKYNIAKVNIIAYDDKMEFLEQTNKNLNTLELIVEGEI